MNLETHISNCPKCGKSVNGNTIKKAITDDISIASTLKKAVDVFVLHKPAVTPPRGVTSDNHLFDKNKCIVCGQ